MLFWVIQQSSMDSWAKLNIAVIAPYPFIMIGLVATGLVDSALGRSLVLLDGTLVGALAQWTGLRSNEGEAHPVPS